MTIVCCSYPILTPEGFALPKCLDLVSADDVINAVENYLKYDSYAWRAIYAATGRDKSAAGRLGSSVTLA